MPTCRVFIGSSGEQVRLVEWLTSFIASNYPGRLEPVPRTIPWPGGLFTLEHRRPAPTSAIAGTVRRRDGWKAVRAWGGKGETKNAKLPRRRGATPSPTEID